MITWVTVWVLTVYSTRQQDSVNYQLTYATQVTCLKELDKHKEVRRMEARCDFQQIPMKK